MTMGVGTQKNPFLKLVGSAFGCGLSRNVKELYTALCRVYEEQDEIFLFCFSRGAFTVRTVAGLIVELGVVDPTKTREQGEELETIIGNNPEAWSLGDLVRSSVGQLAIIVAFVGLVGGLALYVDFQQLCDS